MSISSLPGTVPSVLLIDDVLDEVRGLAQNLCDTNQIRAKALQPEDVSERDVTEVNVVLIDYRLDDWPERDLGLGAIGRRPLDGIALSATLRSHLTDKQSPTAFGILTARIGELAGQLPVEHRNHVVSSARNLEWVFEKKDSELRDRIVSLADAIAQLPERWNPDSGGHPLRGLMTYLGVDASADDAGVLTRDVEKCLPPIHVLSEYSHGLAVVRWILHRILPYPCFLWDSRYLASRLHVTHEALKAELGEGATLRTSLKDCEYSGQLDEFLGPRWWRSRIELLLWDRTARRSFDSAEVHHVACDLAGTDLTKTGCEHPVVCLGEDYVPLDECVDLDEAVPIQPDDWPAYADQAWASTELAKESAQLRTLVAAEDREKLV